MCKTMYVAICTSVLIVLMGCASQPLSVEQRTKTTILDFQNKTQQELYKKTLEWIATDFSSGKEVLEYSDEAQGKVIGNMQSKLSSAEFKSADITAKISTTIDCKDNKVRLTYLITGISGVSQSGPWAREVLRAEIDGAKDSTSKITDSYKNFIETNKTTNW